MPNRLLYFLWLEIRVKIQHWIWSVTSTCLDLLTWLWIIYFQKKVHPSYGACYILELKIKTFWGQNFSKYSNIHMNRRVGSFLVSSLADGVDTKSYRLIIDYTVQKKKSTLRAFRLDQYPSFWIRQSSHYTHFFSLESAFPNDRVETVHFDK